MNLRKDHSHTFFGPMAENSTKVNTNRELRGESLGPGTGPAESASCSGTANTATLGSCVRRRFGGSVRSSPQHYVQLHLPFFNPHFPSVGPVTGVGRLFLTERRCGRAAA